MTISPRKGAGWAPDGFSGNASTSVAVSFRRNALFSARIRASVTIAMVTAPLADFGVWRASQAPRPSTSSSSMKPRRIAR